MNEEIKNFIKKSNELKIIKESISELIFQDIRNKIAPTYEIDIKNIEEFKNVIEFELHVPCQEGENNILLGNFLEKLISLNKYEIISLETSKLPDGFIFKMVYFVKQNN